MFNKKISLPTTCTTTIMEVSTEALQQVTNMIVYVFVIHFEVMVFEGCVCLF